MLREHNSGIMIRWSPKEKRGGDYDPTLFIETPEQARKLICHLKDELRRAETEKNQELVLELDGVLSRVENLSRKFFRWEQAISRSLHADELREIRKLPLQF
jgi:hypothetical protein